jgi:hypothetical protein
MPRLFQACFGPSRAGRVHLIDGDVGTTRLVMCESTTPTNHLVGRISAERFCKRCLELATRRIQAAGIGDILTAEIIGVQEIL